MAKRTKKKVADINYPAERITFNGVPYVNVAPDVKWVVVIRGVECFKFKLP